ncbi:hypothetical protein NPIL_413181 [Nephila pilipes]|uniref:Uncharacterized protein n=1 Tax=Nephila pilipes TaxID=299642 RepID=A0A8X6NJI2_NEPPI|nr:hypothetical protein NPIL_413181 [Nephila pilipes]
MYGADYDIFYRDPKANSIDPINVNSDDKLAVSAHSNSKMRDIMKKTDPNFQDNMICPTLTASFSFTANTVQPPSMSYPIISLSPVPNLQL